MDTAAASSVVLCSRFFSPSRQCELTKVKSSGRELNKGLRRERPRHGITGAASLVLRCRYSWTTTSEPFCVPNLDDAISALAASVFVHKACGSCTPRPLEKSTRRRGQFGGHGVWLLQDANAISRFSSTFHVCVSRALLSSLGYFRCTRTPSPPKKISKGGRPSIACI